MATLKMIGTVAGLVLAMALAAQADVVTVYPGNMQGWEWYADYGDAVTAMVPGPDTPPLGAGSAHLNTGAHGDGAAGIWSTNHAGTRIADITTLTYSAYCTLNNGQQFPYLVIGVDVDDDATAEDWLFFEPPYQTPGAGSPSLPDQGEPLLNTWQTWDARHGGWGYSSLIPEMQPGSGPNGVKSLDYFLATYPDATIVEEDLLVGWCSEGDLFNGYVDNFSIGTAAGSTTYNFEVTPEPATLGLLAAGGVATLLRRKRSK